MSERQRWLWQGRIPLGELVIPAGPEKLGKSTTMLWVSARVSRGELIGDLEGQPRNVAYISAEDSASRVLKPRLVAAGADLSRVYLLNPHPDAELFSVDGLKEIPDLALVVLDPLSVFLDLHASSNEHGEIVIRNTLRPFVQLAQELTITVAGVRHLNKSPSGTSPYDAVMGSRAFSATARMIVFFAADPERTDGSQGGLIFARGNLAAPAPPIRYRLDTVEVELDDGERDDVVVYVPEDSTTGLTLEEAMGPQDNATALHEAADWLTDLLADGKVEAKTMERLARDAGHAWRTVRRARARAHVISERDGFGKGSKSFWALDPAYLSIGGPVQNPGPLCDPVATYEPPVASYGFCLADGCSLTADESGLCWKHRSPSSEEGL